VIILYCSPTGRDKLRLLRHLARGLHSVILIGESTKIADRIAGLECGADDYLSTTCSPRELVARVRAVLRGRSDHRFGAQAEGAIYGFADYVFDARHYWLRGPYGPALTLTFREVALLVALLDEANSVLSRAHLLERTSRGATAGLERSIDVQINRLRRKLAACNGRSVIRTVRLGGYKLAAKVTRR
jgi:two-component system OmpR family response regulator